MLKKDLIDVVANKTGYTKKDITPVIDTMLDTIANFVAGGDELKLSGFGTFVPVEKDARVARNPKTGEIVNTPAKRSIKFKPSSALKKFVNHEE